MCPRSHVFLAVLAHGVVCVFTAAWDLDIQHTHTLPYHTMPTEPPEAFRSAFKINKLTDLLPRQFVPLWTCKGLITDNRDFWYFPITAPQQESKQYVLGLYCVRHACPATSMCKFALFFNMVKLYIYSRIASELIVCGSSPVSFLF